MLFRSNQLKETIHKVFDFLPTKDFPTCLESFECVPDFFADICPSHIDCEDGMEEDLEDNECLPTVAWPRALLIDLDQGSKFALRIRFFAKRSEAKANRFAFASHWGKRIRFAFASHKILNFRFIFRTAGDCNISMFFFIKGRKQASGTLKRFGFSRIFSNPN